MWLADRVLPLTAAERRRQERDVYFEVSAVIIAFVLLGKYMEEIIKKKSSAAPPVEGEAVSGVTEIDI